MNGQGQSALGFMEELENGAEVQEEYLGVYDSKEVISALVKCIRLCKVGEAIYWYEVLVKGGAELPYIARRLMIESQESGYGPLPAIYADAVFRIISIGRSHAQDAMVQLIIYLCRCKKWWEDPDMRGFIRQWYRSEKEVIAVRDGKTEPRPIPDYALDRHTPRGREMAKKGHKIDERFSGSERGVFTMMTMFEKFGRLSEEDRLTTEEERSMRKDIYAPFGPKKG